MANNLVNYGILKLNTHRFNDPFLFATTILPGPLELFEVKRQNKCLREEAKLFLAKVNLHSRQIPP